jgi:murein DD-endopeptidase MepM/ murein hydrolase activator NlpD
MVERAYLSRIFSVLSGRSNLSAQSIHGSAFVASSKAFYSLSSSLFAVGLFGLAIQTTSFAQEQTAEAPALPPQGLTTLDEILAYGVADSLIERPYRVGEQTFTLELQQGENLSLLLARAGIANNDRYAIAAVLEEHMDLRRLRPGKEFTLTMRHNGLSSELRTLEVLPSVDTIVLVNRNPDSGVYTATAIPNELTSQLSAGEGAITQSLFATAVEQGVPDAVVLRAIQAYSFNVDFQRDIQPNDEFAILYEQDFFADGTLARNGNILHARLTLSGRDLELFRFEDAEGLIDYYNRDGESMRRFLMRTPIDGARLSSRFGMRRHPVLGYSRMHRGIDFAAPSGTPIYAAGDGVIDFLGTNSGYGRYIRLRHNSRLSTAYAHMSRYGSGLSQGDRVQQGDIIGYVGTSGLSTGPHLHYEVMVSGTQVNPLDVDLPTGRNLEGNELAQFQGQIRDMDEALQTTLSSRTAATGGD